MHDSGLSCLKIAARIGSSQSGVRRLLSGHFRRIREAGSNPRRSLGLAPARRRVAEFIADPKALDLSDPEIAHACEATEEIVERCWREHFARIDAGYRPARDSSSLDDAFRRLPIDPPDPVPASLSERLGVASFYLDAMMPRPCLCHSLAASDRSGNVTLRPREERVYKHHVPPRRSTS